MRDLGAHLSIFGKLAGHTLNERFRKVMDVIYKTGRLPLTFAQQTSLIRPNVLTAALFGCESAPFDDAPLIALRAAIVRVIGPSKTCTSNDLAFSPSSYRIDIDPLVQILVRKVVLMRRVLAKRPQLLDMISQSLAMYRKCAYVGIWYSGMAMEEVHPAPSPGYDEWKAWKAKTNAWGPMGLLCDGLWYAGAVLDVDTFAIKSFQEVDIPVFALPIQHLRPAVCALAMRARTTAASLCRSLFDGIKQLDNFVLKQALAKACTDDANLVHYVATGGALSNEQLFKFGLEADHACPHCNKPLQTITHTIFDCPHPELVAAREDLHVDDVCDFAKASPDDLPLALKHGLPPEMGTDAFTTFWNVIMSRASTKHPACL